MWDYLSYRKMITPFIIQITYWAFSALCIASGIYIIFVRNSPAKGIAIALLSPIIIRVACEIIIVFFRIYQTLLKIEKNLELSYEGEAFEMKQPANEVDKTEINKPLFDIITADKINNNSIKSS